MSSETPTPPSELTWLERHRQYTALRESVLPANKTALFNALADAGVTRVDIAFDGEGDSGQIESITAIGNGSEIALPSCDITIMRVHEGDLTTTPVTMPVSEVLEDLAYAFLRDNHSGWENNDGAYGEFTFDVATRSIALDHYERVVDTEHTHHDF
jgi:hypothetical protein